MTDLSVLADLRDQIVRLQQQWREEARAECEDQLPGWFGAQSKLTACADELDPLLTLVRSIVEAQKAEEEMSRIDSTRLASTPDATAGKD